jgi:hypothetical protein
VIQVEDGIESIWILFGAQVRQGGLRKEAFDSLERVISVTGFIQQGPVH